MGSYMMYFTVPNEWRATRVFTVCKQLQITAPSATAFDLGIMAFLSVGHSGRDVDSSHVPSSMRVRSQTGESNIS